jgi:hypothetical protein
MYFNATRAARLSVIAACISTLNIRTREGPHSQARRFAIGDLLRRVFEAATPAKLRRAKTC